jgi:hypothetical protein
MWLALAVNTHEFTHSSGCEAAQAGGRADKAVGLYTSWVVESQDSQRTLADEIDVLTAQPRTMTRQERGLPEDAFAMTSFGNGYKINETLFTTWLELLQEKPGSVLWVIDDNTQTMESASSACIASFLQIRNKVLGIDQAVPPPSQAAALPLAKQA